MFYDDLRELLEAEIGTAADQAVDCLRAHFGGQRVYIPTRRPVSVDQHRGNVRETARRLGVSTRTVYRRLKK